MYEPTEGRLILFLSKQRHRVTMNHTEGVKISLSFDIVLAAKPGSEAGAYEFLLPPPDQWKKFSQYS